MTKTLSMVGHKNYNLNTSEGFVMFFDFQVNYMLLMTVSLRKENPNQWLIYSMKVNIYIGFRTLTWKCIQYGILYMDKAAFKNARVKPRLGG